MLSDEAFVSKKLKISFDKLHGINVKMESFELVLENIRVTLLDNYIDLGIVLRACFGVIGSLSRYEAQQSNTEPAINLQPPTSPLVALTSSPPLRLRSCRHFTLSEGGVT